MKTVADAWHLPLQSSRALKGKFKPRGPYLKKRTLNCYLPFAGSWLPGQLMAFGGSLALLNRETRVVDLILDHHLLV
jgi:hypothetical protein